MPSARMRLRPSVQPDAPTPRPTDPSLKTPERRAHTCRGGPLAGRRSSQRRRHRAHPPTRPPPRHGWPGRPPTSPSLAEARGQRQAVAQKTGRSGEGDGARLPGPPKRPRLRRRLECSPENHSSTLDEGGRSQVHVSGAVRNSASWRHRSSRGRRRSARARSIHRLARSLLIRPASASSRPRRPAPAPGTSRQEPHRRYERRRRHFAPDTRQVQIRQGGTWRCVD